ncbi:MAG TPA: UDP-3-O-(3-hydroxymyristoyl)glucosamine N-acyltransferase [Chthonomonadaceae bacterium]|nr:UDP-3-O-(3-hydroxymyristoyl)glucosamine N-acyltransferase [Chthonomonadaceae bacterium]
MPTPETSAPTLWTLQEIAALVGGTPRGALDTPITGLASIEEARPGELVFAESGKYLALALRSSAAAVLTTAEAEAIHGEKPIVVVADPRYAFAQVLEAFAPPVVYAPGIHPSAQIGEGVALGAGVHIGAQVTVGDSVTLEANVVLHPGVRIGEGCTLGEGTILHPNVVLYPGVTVGKRCKIHAGSVIGSEGFGFVPLGSRLKRVPHLGSVQIGDEVEIGANVTIDRAKTGATVIGAGTKIDNLVHIAHNVRIGLSCILVSQVGLAGSVTLGNGVILAGQAGIIPHIHVGDGARLAAQSGLMNDVPAGQTWFGSPAIPHADRLREIAASRKLSDTMKQIRAMEKRLAELEARLNGQAPSSADL